MNVKKNVFFYFFIFATFFTFLKVFFFHFLNDFYSKNALFILKNVRKNLKIIPRTSRSTFKTTETN